jgi:glycosyltransferase involved in cell wall biosynthesis
VVGINLPHKNLATLAAVWNGLAEPPPLHLVAAGPADPRYPDLGTLVGRRGAGRVTSLGRVGEDELEWLYRNATMVLFPTLYEGFGLPMVEAFAHGVPVLASDIPVLREAGEGVARFVGPLDSAAWAREVCRLAGDEQALRTMADAGRVRAAEYTYEHTARATLEVLRQAAGAPAVAPTNTTA